MMNDSEKKFWAWVFIVAVIFLYIFVFIPSDRQYKMDLTLKAIQTHEASRAK